jgi:cold shock CspA family protein
MVAGRVVRFDSARGYGFIAPEHGGDDVFLHVNDLLFPEAYLRSGLAVEFEAEDGGRGMKASNVRLAQTAEVKPQVAVQANGAAAAPSEPCGPAPKAAPSAVRASGSGQEGNAEFPTCDVLSADEYTQEVTELLLKVGPSLTGEQILQIRHELLKFSENHGWIED